MDNSSIDPIERRLAALPTPRPPAQLRQSVLTGVHRQLAASRWDRRLARAAAALLIVGIGLNAAVGWRGSGSSDNRGSSELNPETVSRAAVAIGEGTNAEAGTEIARHLAALGGFSLTAQQETAIQRQIETHSKRSRAPGKDG